VKAFDFKAQPSHFHFDYLRMFAKEITLQAQSIAFGFAFAQLLMKAGFDKVGVFSLCYL
jgi:hypothetical protein